MRIMKMHKWIPGIGGKSLNTLSIQSPTHFTMSVSLMTPSYRIDTGGNHDD